MCVRESVCVWPQVCVRAWAAGVREKERESVCVWPQVCAWAAGVRERERECVCVWPQVCVCEWAAGAS